MCRWSREMCMKTNRLIGLRRQITEGHTARLPAFSQLPSITQSLAGQFIGPFILRPFAAGFLRAPRDVDHRVRPLDSDVRCSTGGAAWLKSSFREV